MIAMGAAIVMFFFLPWLDRAKVRSIRYRGWMYKTALTIFAVTFVMLGYLGTKNPGHIDLFLFESVVIVYCCEVLLGVAAYWLTAELLV